MNNFLKFLVACLFVYLLMKSFPQSTPINGYATKMLPKDTISYLKTSAQYSPYYNAGKKFAVYYTGMDCPYGQAFANGMTAIWQNPAFQKDYNFSVTQISGNSLQKTFTSVEEAKSDGKFMDICQQFCIVNPKTGGIYSLNGVGENDAANLPNLFEKLKDW